MTTWLKSLIMRQNSQLLSAPSSSSSCSSPDCLRRPSNDLLDDAMSDHSKLQRLRPSGEVEAQICLGRQQVISNHRDDQHQHKQHQLSAQQWPASRLKSQNGHQHQEKTTTTTTITTTSCNHCTTSNICSDTKLELEKSERNKMWAACQEEKEEESKSAASKTKATCRAATAAQAKSVNNVKNYLSTTATSQDAECSQVMRAQHRNGRLQQAAHLLSCLLVCLLIAQSNIKVSGAASTSSSSPSGQQYFDGQPEQFTLIASGQDVRLRCLIRNRLGECAWVRNNQVIGNIKSKYSYARHPDDGDCSLRIQNASVTQDDGLWQCQVLATELDQLNLQSRLATLLVLVPPERPQIKDLPSPGAQQGNPRLVVEENATKSITCEIRGGNPAPLIEWQLDGKNISNQAQSSSFLVSNSNSNSNSNANQNTNANARITSSKLRLADIKRTMNGKNLTCFGLHQTNNQSVSVELDVQYVPTVNVAQREYSIVEGSPLSIGCQVDANPAATLVGWRLTKDGPPALSGNKRSGEPPTTSVGPMLEFQHITRDSNQDRYECFAQNPLGTSAAVEVRLNVLFAPAVLNSSHSDSIQLGNSTHLSCLFEGNPSPEIKWFYVDPLSKLATTLQLENDKMSQLQLKNVTYRNEGDYYCEARNYINGQVYAVRSSNILLDIYGEPQFLMKSPVLAKAVQGAKSDIALTFCSDPPPQRVYWQFGSIVLNVRLNGPQQQAANGQQVPPVGLANSKLHQQQQQRFQVQPLQPIQRRDSNFAKVHTCFESTLTLLDPELHDQRDYTLNVHNERGHQSGYVRLRVSSPLSPVLMISSALVTICGLFLCSFVFMFIFKKRQSFLTSTGGGGGGANGTASGNSQRSLRASQAAKMLAAANGKQTNGALNGQLTANGHDTQHGVVNGAGNGLANGAANPVAQLDTETAKALHMMSMASSDTSCNDQKQLLASSDRTSSASGSSSGRMDQGGSGGGGCGGPTGSDNQAADHYMASNSNGGDRSTANSTPSQMNHISVDDELQLGNGSYQAAESVTRGARLSPPGSSLGHHSAGASTLIYANIDYNQPMHGHQLHSPGLNMAHQQQQHHHRAPIRRQHTPIGSPTGSHDSATSPVNSINSQTGGNARSSVGATIAMMNSLAAAAAASATQGTSSPGSGVLNGAINQQLANSRQLVRKPGPPKPPKPSIQQRSRFYQQQAAAAAASGGLVMIGSHPQGPDQEQQVVGPSNSAASDLAVEYSRIAFPARAEL